MKLFTAAQMQEADRRAAATGAPTDLLMEAAGKATADRLKDLFPTAWAVVVLCGRGNNGGDGYVVARELLADGPPVKVLELSDRPASEAAARARLKLVETGLVPEPLTADSLRDWIDEHCGDDGAIIEAVIVDALLGSGLDRPLEGDLAELVRIVNRGLCRVLAVDVPTGIDADSAVPPGLHVQADATVQLAGPKIASFFQPARAAYAAGPHHRQRAEFVAAIGIPGEILEELSDVSVLDEGLVRGWLPERSPRAHKYDAGTVTVVGGSQRYLGAAELACRGAWRAGAGLVTLIANERLAGAWPETIFAELPLPRSSVDPAHSGSEAVLELPPWPPAGLTPKQAAACVAGPGLDPASSWLLGPLLEWAPGRLVLDAGALDPAALETALAEAGEELTARLVLTPHAGEAARLLSHFLGPMSAAEVNADPLASATGLAERLGATVVLKGATTVIARPGGRAAVCSRGHPGLASGGTGDVLAGVIAALLAPGDGAEFTAATVFERTCLAVFVHAVAGERSAAGLGNSLIASDVVSELGPALFALGWGA